MKIIYLIRKILAIPFLAIAIILSLPMIAFLLLAFAIESPYRLYGNETLGDYMKRKGI